MKRILTAFLITLCLLSFNSYAQFKLANQIWEDFYPDPAICKAGSNYYIANSTFSYFSGIPMYATPEGQGSLGKATFNGYSCIDETFIK